MSVTIKFFQLTVRIDGQLFHGIQITRDDKPTMYVHSHLFTTESNRNKFAAMIRDSGTVNLRKKCWKRSEHTNREHFVIPERAVA